MSEAGFEKLFRTQFPDPELGPSEQAVDFVSCWSKRGAYRLLLEPSFKVAFNDFISSGGLIVCC